ncbi:signal recognition particle subunit SRP68 [Klebsormidium nitens]|uniref:Signal recognition particle subunit SRP68 n=1 Tax=Klebsormidium nitens TaxID=105231 RepID=A0A1Y1IMJ0_KLENI|nr:signal recognition particle subunit SRP68 [Klebsormidium nitens]|eukprot:GAQ90361.1 signal recognition particle subunit SRP68 [Klebsormidium nitens]
MELKHATDGPTTRMRFHLLKRLQKAAKLADKFAALCAQRADDQTSLEAEAYAAYMWGSLLLERESDWQEALKRFSKAKTIYEQLGTVGTVEQRVLCRERVEELEPSIRYCKYKSGGGAQAEDLSELTNQEGPGMDILQSKLEMVMEEARAKQAASMTELPWQGRRLPVRNEKTRVCILRVDDLMKDLEGSASSPLTHERRLGIYDKVFVALQDAKKHVRDDLASAGGATAPADVADELQSLDNAVSGMLLQRTIERNQLFVEAAKAKLERQERGLPGEKGEKAARPEDLVRLYDTLLQNVSDLSDIATSVRNRKEEDVELEKACEAKQLALRASRCFYVAQSYSNAAKFAEAYVLFKRAAEQAQSASEAYRKVKRPDERDVADAQDVLSRARTQRSLVHARGCAEAARSEEAVQKGVKKLDLRDAAVKDKGERKPTLLEALDEYVPAIGAANSKEAPRIAEIPPAFQAVPCRPIVLDTALNAITFPSLEHKVKKEEKKSGLLGWFRR